MARPIQDTCKRGHSLNDAHIVQTIKGIKRTCRKCRYIRYKRYNKIGEYKGYRPGGRYAETRIGDNSD